MKRKIIFFLLTFIVLFSTACNSKETNENKIEYEEFVSLFDKMNSEMKLTDYENLGGNEGIQLIYIDKKISFDKRNYLTIDNQQSNSPTQFRIEYIDSENKSLATIDLIYLENVLENNLIYWDNPIVNNTENEFLRKKYNENIISYKNILIKTCLFAIGANEVDDSTLTTISEDVVDFIQNTY